MAENKHDPKKIIEALRTTRKLIAKQEESRKNLLQLEKVLWSRLPDKYKFGLKLPR